MTGTWPGRNRASTGEETGGMRLTPVEPHPWVIHLTAAGKPSRCADMADELHITAADHAYDPDCPARHLVVSCCTEEVFSAPGVIEAIRLERLAQLTSRSARHSARPA
jgi:hypothetical protein